MNCFVPWRRNVPSGMRMALHFRAPTSEPAEGSVSAIVPPQTPAYIFSMYFFFWTSVP